MEAFFEDIKELFFGNDRAANLKQIALQQGFQFLKKYSYRDLPYEIKTFELFKGKNQKRLRSLLARLDAEKGIQYKIFDFHNYKDYGAKKATVVYISSGSFDFPEFEVHPKGLSEKLVGLFAKKNLFAHFPEFLDVYRVKCREIGHMEYLMSQEVLKMLLKDQTIIIEGAHNHLIFYRKNELIEPADLMPFFEQCKRITELMLEDNSNDYV